ncbi:MFS transporter [bacterium]|nr:MFS transporter [bacterium]
MNDKKQIFGWAMYDWANSAYVTTVAVAVLPIFFSGVVVGEGGYEFLGVRYDSQSLWGFMMSFSALWVFIFAPVLGAISDFSASKKKFLMVFCYMGSLFSILLFFCGSGDVVRTMIFFMIAQIGFVGGNVFYDAFLPQIASEDTIDRVSGKGFAYGYVGGGLQFALSLALIAGHDRIGISESLAARIAIATAGLWWAGFSIITFIRLKEMEAVERFPETYRSLPPVLAYAKIGLSRTVATAKKVRKFKHLLLFLIAFMIYNDGIQTVISMSTIYGTSELKLPSWVLMATLLIIQFIAFFGALIFSRLAEKTTAKKALMLTLLIWAFVVVYAYFITSAKEFFILGILVGLTMGGSQSLSRSLYGSMIPKQASAEFYGFYSVFSKFSSIWGPAVFAVINIMSGSSRNAIISLVVFFALGIIILSFVDVEKAREAKTSALFT